MSRSTLVAPLAGVLLTTDGLEVAAAAKIRAASLGFAPQR